MRTVGIGAEKDITNTEKLQKENEKLKKQLKREEEKNKELQERIEEILAKEAE